MRHLITALCLFIATPVLAECPAQAPQTERRAALLDSLRAAQDANAAQEAIGNIWMFWRTAPDEPAQELLDTGLQALRYGDYLRAEQSFTRLTGYCPDYAEGWNQLAFAYFLTDRDDQSLAALDRVIALEPAHFGALAGMGLIHIRAGRPEVGQIWLRKAVAINPWLNERGLIQQAPGTGSDL